MTSGPEERDDLLADAFAAFRDETAEENDRISASPTAVETRARIRRVADARVQRRGLAVRLVLPFAALLAVSGAWAAVTHRLPVIFGPGRAAATSSVPPTLVAPPRPARSGAWPTVRHDRGAPTETPPPVLPTVAPPATSGSPSAAGAAAAADPEDVRYRAAHEAHFVTRDWPRALDAWDAYLAAHPAGRFAPEARYNRALVLLRLDRRSEARAALEPFASGEMGGYRQAEARSLLDALE